MIGAKFLAPHASRASASLARKFTYRRRVERDIHKRVGFVYPRRSMRAWLKSLRSADLEEPVELGGPRLAAGLDQHLAKASVNWSRGSERASLALRLVEAAYLAILKEEDEPRSRQLSEEWARHRNDALVASMVQLVGGHAPLANDDLAIWMRRRATERRRIRVAAFSIPVDSVTEAMKTSASLVPQVPAGTVCTLVGPFGAGKSEVAEEWHALAIDRFESSRDQPIPVWLDAGALRTASLEAAIASQAGHARARQYGVALVLDGLDEVEGSVAEAAAADARVYVAGDSRSSVLLTCRPGVLAGTEGDVIINGLEPDRARGLVDAVAGRSHATWQWSDDLIDTIRRPFFALAAGSLLAAGEVVTGQVELMAKLVERALSRGQRVGGSAETYAVLGRLAVGLTRSGRRTDGLDFRERQVALLTRLVAGDPTAGVAFALPIFEQWFAGRELAERPELDSEVFQDPQAFDRWRWALAVAVLNGGTSRADDLVATCMQMNVGAGAWLIDQVSARQFIVKDNAEPLDQGQSGQRLLRVLRVWSEALGPLARYTIRGATSPALRIGVRVNGRHVSVGWSSHVPVADEVIELPDIVLPIPSEWIQVSTRTAIGELWPWTLVRDQVAGSTLKVLDGHNHLGVEGGVWSNELNYLFARIVMQNRSVFHRPMGATEVRCEVDRLLETARSSVHATFNLGAGTVTRDDLDSLRGWLDQRQEQAEIVRPLPRPDILQPARGSVTDCYSKERMVVYCAEMLGQGLAAYDELAGGAFSAFAWALASAANRPIGAVGEVLYGSGHSEPTLEYFLLPLVFAVELSSLTDEFEQAANGRAWVRLGSDQPSISQQVRSETFRARLLAWMAARSSPGPFAASGLSGSRGLINCQHDRAASLFAARLLYQDLKLLALGSGTFPQLRR